jgi:polyketide synthase 12
MNCASDALRFIAQAKHVGKVVLVPAQQRRDSAHGAVLMTGGVARWPVVARWLATSTGERLRADLAPRNGHAGRGIAGRGTRGPRRDATVVACDAATPMRWPP